LEDDGGVALERRRRGREILAENLIMIWGGGIATLIGFISGAQR
jgi:hypothetical protein